MSIKHLNLTNFNTSGNLISDKQYNFEGLSFVMFYSKPCCVEEINVFNDLHNNIQVINTSSSIRLNFYLYEVKGINTSIVSILKDAPYRIMGYPYVVTFFNGEFCSVYRPNDLPEPNKLSNDIINYGRKISQKVMCKLN
jgi:hypothetical protein